MMMAQLGNFGGHSEYKEGGFLSNQGPFNSNATSTGTDSSPGQRRGRALPNRSLLPVTIKQLLDAKQSPEDDSTFRVDNRDLSDVSLIGVIRVVSENPTNVIYTVEDGTGKIDLRQWIDSTDNGADVHAAARRAQLREGIYVRAFGTLRSFQNRRSVGINFVRPIEDFNEITFHFLECIHSHLSSARQNSASIKLSWGSNVQSNVMSPQSAAPLGGNNAASYSMMPSSYVKSGAMSAMDGDFTPLQSKMMALIRGNPANEGTNVSFLVSELRGMANEKQVRAAIEWLSTEGHVYSSIDDEHFKATDA